MGSSQCSNRQLPGRVPTPGIREEHTHTHSAVRQSLSQKIVSKAAAERQQQQQQRALSRLPKSFVFSIERDSFDFFFVSVFALLLLLLLLVCCCCCCWMATCTRPADHWRLQQRRRQRRHHTLDWIAKRGKKEKTRQEIIIIKSRKKTKIVDCAAFALVLCVPQLLWHFVAVRRLPFAARRQFA